MKRFLLVLLSLACALPLLSDTTPKRNYLPLTGGTVTGTTNFSSGVVQVKGATLQCFMVQIFNNAGTMQHAIFGDIGQGGASNFAGQVSGASATLTATPSVAAGVAFAAGAGIDSTATQYFIFNTAAQVTADNLAFAFVEKASVESTITAAIAYRSSNVNGVTQNRLALTLWNAVSGASYAWTTVNIPAGKEVDVRVCGFFD